jgi:hypothetical protein
MTREQRRWEGSARRRLADGLGLGLRAWARDDLCQLQDCGQSKSGCDFIVAFFFSFLFWTESTVRGGAAAGWAEHGLGTGMVMRSDGAVWQ